MHSFQDGYLAEHAFCYYIEGLGWTSSLSASDKDLEEHWDVSIKKDTRCFLVDVKTTKSINRADQDTTTDYFLLEWINVRGNKGWLQGKADYIAFQLEDCFLMANRKKLSALFRQKCNMGVIRNPPIKPIIFPDEIQFYIYRVYRRKNRLDSFAYFPRNDIETCCEDLGDSSVVYSSA